MRTNLSKLCADFLRTTYASNNAKIKASHARELVAAFFGYKSHAALIADQQYPVDDLEDAKYLVPDIPLLDQRRARLTDLPNSLKPTRDLAKGICSFLQSEQYFVGDVWLYESLENYVIEELLVKHDALLLDELYGIMAETNAYFDEAYFETATIQEDEHGNLVVIVDGTYSGTNHEDKPFCGDQIDMKVSVTFYRIAGQRGFLDYDISAGGEINDDWVDPELKYGPIPSKRPQEQFIEMTRWFPAG